MSSVQAVPHRPANQIGLYGFASLPPEAEKKTAQLEDRVIDWHKCLAGARTLTSLSTEDLDGVDCIIVDIRHDASKVLYECREAALKRPIIVIADCDQLFEEDYPYGTHVSDVTSLDELGRSVFWHRVDLAVRAYHTPLSIDDTTSPVYSVFKSIADQTSDWILIKDLQHRFVVAGEHFAATAGTPLDAIIGCDDLEIGSSREAVLGNAETGDIGFWAQDDEVTNSARATVEENSEWFLYSRMARYRRTYRVPLKNPAGQVFALLVCSQDITEQVRNEELLNERTSMLDQVTGEKKQAEISRKLAEDAVRAKTRFLAAASHDLRQPLHAVGLFLDSLEKRVEGREERYLVHQIKQSCTALGNLFNSCLDISRLDAGVVERRLEHFSAATFLETLNEEFRRQAHEKSLDYRLTVDTSVIYSDQVLLARIVRNLLSNAIQNTDSGYLYIECRQAESCVEMSVIDTGRGIAPEESEQVFSEFHQVNSSDAQNGHGLGLGLSIVKRLCDLLDIKIMLESALGQGACFTLSIPTGHVMKVAQVDEPVLSMILPEELVVLIVDDDQSIRSGMQVLLESYGCQTLCAADTDDALRLLKAQGSVPDIIVADYHLSMNKTGTQAILDLREYLAESVPAILVTGDTSTDSVREATVHDLPILYKPVDSDELLATINTEVRRIRASTRDS